MFSLSYRDAPYQPYWGPVSSKENFCEEDYILTPYIAEVVSTLTNVGYLAYAYYGIKSNRKRPDALLRCLPYLGLAAVGIFSAVFHSSLKYYTQWVDEMSMHIANTTVLHRLYTFNRSAYETSTIGLALTVIMSTFAVFHCWADEVLLHSLLFAAMIVAVGLRTRSLIKTRITCPLITQQVTNVVTFGAITFIGGFVLWNIDTALCSQLRAIRRVVGMPWSFVLELHGWWHIFTGMGAYTFMALVEYLTSEEAGQPLGDRFAWPIGLFITRPDEEKCALDGLPSVQVNGKSNGQANGKANGNINGHTNVQTNGHLNGSTNGNANGQTTGHTNGGEKDRAR